MQAIEGNTGAFLRPPTPIRWPHETRLVVPNAGHRPRAFLHTRYAASIQPCSEELGWLTVVNFQASPPLVEEHLLTTVLAVHDAYLEPRGVGRHWGGLLFARFFLTLVVLNLFLLLKDGWTATDFPAQRGEKCQTCANMNGKKGCSAQKMGKNCLYNIFTYTHATYTHTYFCIHMYVYLYYMAAELVRSPPLGSLSALKIRRGRSRGIFLVY